MKKLFALAFVGILSSMPMALSQTAPAWKSFSDTGNTVDIVKSTQVAAQLGLKVDVTDGRLESPTLDGGVETVTPTDVPGSTGTALVNSGWVDLYYIAKETFITSATTWTVCASGCKYTSPLDAWHAAEFANILGNATLTISIADGTYNISDQMFTASTSTQNVQIIGNTTTPANVVLNFTNTKGSNLSGVAAYRGGKVGYVDGVTIQTPTDGTGALASIDSSGRHIWNSQSYGAGIIAYDSGSNVTVGPHVVIHGFYYSMVADNNGGIDAPNGHVTMSLAGDVNAMARGGGVIVCNNCSATDASDYTNTAIPLGSNYDAERGGSLYIDGSTGSKSLVNGVVGLTGGHIWAHNTTFTGSLISGSGNGAWVTGNSSAEFTGSSFSGYLNGVDSMSGGQAFVDTTTLTGNTNGAVADGGSVSGDGAIITNNTQYGVQALHQGHVTLYNAYANMTGNGTNFSAEAAGTDSTSGAPYTASSIVLQ